MATDTNKKPSKKENTFTCKYCEKVKPFDEMVVVTDYFPAIVICKDCAGHIR